MVTPDLAAPAQSTTRFVVELLSVASLVALAAKRVRPYTVALVLVGIAVGFFEVLHLSTFDLPARRGGVSRKTSGSLLVLGAFGHLHGVLSMPIRSSAPSSGFHAVTLRPATSAPLPPPCDRSSEWPPR